MMKPGDELVLAHLRQAPNGASAMAIAKAALGARARRHSRDALNMIGLAIASRLCGLQLIEPTRTNQFKLTQRKAA